MMKNFLSMIFLMFCFVGISQKQIFYDHISAAETKFFELTAATNETVDVVNLNTDNLSGKIMFAWNDARKKKGRVALTQNIPLKQYCFGAQQYFHRSYYQKKSTEEKLKIYTERGLRFLDAPCRHFQVAAFTVNIVDLHSFQRFYFDKSDGETPLGLFLGKRPKSTNPDSDNYEEPVPISYLTENELVENILVDIRRRIGNEMYSKDYENFAIEIIVNDNTLFRHKIPTANVLVIIAGKQLQKVRG